MLEELWENITRHLLADWLRIERKFNRFRFDAVFQNNHPSISNPVPTVTVAVCTRDRSNLLKQCLDSLCMLDYPSFETIVIDNAPSNESTKDIVQQLYPAVRYLQEPRPGLNWARNRAILEARGEIIAFIDDDCIADTFWIKAFGAIFAENPEVMAVTGLVFPYELETEAQILFERSGGFGRGFYRKWYCADAGHERSIARDNGGTGKFGTGSNMAFRLSLFKHIGLFDPVLDVGTPTGGGGDLEMFFRVIKEGYTLVYEPNALIRHIHRRQLVELQSQLKGWGTGLYSHLFRSALAYPKELKGFVIFGSRWLWERNIRRLIISLLYPRSAERSLILAELWGCLISGSCYLRSCMSKAKIEERFGQLAKSADIRGQFVGSKYGAQKRNKNTRVIDLERPLKSLSDVGDYSSTRVYVLYKGSPIGHMDVKGHNNSISAARLQDEIVDAFGLKLLEKIFPEDKRIVVSEVFAKLGRFIVANDTQCEEQTCERLPEDISASVVVATRDRPDDLRTCIRCLIAQKTQRKIEIIIVDNHPGSGLTPSVVAEFPDVFLVNENRRGLSCARNAGILASKGKIIVTTDDDVVMPPDWLEKLVSPFARHDVMAVTGNVLPLSLENSAERLFEVYGGLNRGYQRLEANGNWFKSFGRRAVPTWRLGCTANAAFRFQAFHSPEIGLFDEALGPGTPTGVGEDTYLFYRILKAGYTIIYEPSAFVWHKHRSNFRDLQSQIYSYSKGHVAYHLRTLFSDGDLRAIFRIALELPHWHLRRVREWLFGKRAYPLSLIFAEALGNMAGPVALWRSYLRARREGQREFA